MVKRRRNFFWHDLRPDFVFFWIRGTCKYVVTVSRGTGVYYHVGRDITLMRCQMFLKQFPISLTIMLDEQRQQFWTTFCKVLFLEADCKQQHDTDLFRSLFQPFSSLNQHSVRNRENIFLKGLGNVILAYLNLCISKLRHRWPFNAKNISLSDRFASPFIL